MKSRSIASVILFLFICVVPGDLPAGEPLEGRPLTGVFVENTSPARSLPAVKEAGSETGAGTASPLLAELPVVSQGLQALVAGMDPSEMIRVIIYLKYQPQDLISKQVCDAHEEDMGEIRQLIRMINTRYAEQRKLDTPVDADNYLDPALILSVEDKEALRVVSEEHEALSLVVRDEIAARLREEVESDQQSVRRELERLGATVEFGTICVNALVVVLPVSVIDQVATLDKVASISEDVCREQCLTNADNATRVSDPGGLWEAGETGGLYDPAILDTGTDLLHPALVDDAGRTNFYSWYLVAAHDRPNWDDVLTQDDLHGHGTHVMGIAASHGSAIYPDHLGMAHGAEKAVTLKAGYRDIYGISRMSDSDAMHLVDRALYDTGTLQPLDSFNDDVDGINLSFGAPNYSAFDETPYGRFYSSIIASYPDLVVTIAAGNSGPDNPYFYYPAHAYNPITVGIVDDGGTAVRTDDIINPMSTRGPTYGGRRKPDISAPGTNIDSCNNNWETGVDFFEASGTSMAAPMVLGVAMDLMDAGVIDELEIKALLLNTAQKNDGAIDFEDDADGWDEAYGWGYINALAAYHHRTDLFHDTVTPYPTTGHYHLYKGQMRDEGPTGEGRDRATMVWNRHATYEPHEYPEDVYNLSNLHLFLFDEAAGALINGDVSNIDNVAQVRVGPGAGTTDVIISTMAIDTSFDHGGATEEFALATEEGFVEVDFPSSFWAFANWPAEMEPNEEADITFWIVNNSEIACHNSEFNMQPPPGWTLVSGDNPYEAGSTAGGGGESNSGTWRLRAQPTPEDAVQVGVDQSHYSYYVTWGAYRWNLPVDIRWDTTPPSPAPVWSTTPYALSGSEIFMSCTTSSDLHEPVTYFFDYYNSPTGGSGGTDSGWIPGTAYSDNGLSVNHRYCYRVRAQDNAQTPNATAFNSLYYVYTLANTPGIPTVANPTDTTLDVTINSGGNPDHTDCAIWVDIVGVSGDYYLNDSGGSNGGTPFWQPISSWGTVTATGLASATQYGFSVRARNGDDIVSGWSSSGLGTTTSTPTDTVSAAITCIPASGTVPFATQMTVTLDNLYPGQIRRVAGRINVTLAGGAYFPNWRGGYTNIAGGDSYVSTWNNNIPALGSMIGSNHFQLVAVDVTPNPYNQPPYPPAGDSDSSSCTVVANSP